MNYDLTFKDLETAVNNEKLLHFLLLSADALRTGSDPFATVRLSEHHITLDEMVVLTNAIADAIECVILLKQTSQFQATLEQATKIFYANEE